MCCVLCSSVALRSSGTSSAVARCPINSTSSATSIRLLSIIGVWCVRSAPPRKSSDVPPLRSVTQSEDTCALGNYERHKDERDRSVRDEGAVQLVRPSIMILSLFHFVSISCWEGDKGRMSETGTYSSGHRSMLVAMQCSLLEAIFLI